MDIKQLPCATAEAVDAVVDIHMQTFTGFFLTFLGRGFLKTMYRAYCRYEKAGLLVAQDDGGKIIGFLAYAEDLSGLYKYMIRKELLAFAWYGAGAFLRKPGIFLRLVRAFLKPGESARKEAYVELASIGVLPTQKGMGIGSKLIDALKERVDLTRFAYITLETDALENDAANSFYKKNGFRLARTYETHEGRKMNEYRWGERV